MLPLLRSRRYGGNAYPIRRPPIVAGSRSGYAGAGRPATRKPWLSRPSRPVRQLYGHNNQISGACHQVIDSGRTIAEVAAEPAIDTD